MGRKDKGHKGDKAKRRKRDRATDEPSIEVTAAPTEAVPEISAGPAVQTAPRVSAPKLAAPKGPRPRASTPRAPARPAAARPAAPRHVAAPRTDRPRAERTALPTDRASLLVLHQAARRQRDAAPLLSAQRAEATFEIERIEVQIARVERAMDPPLV